MKEIRRRWMAKTPKWCRNIQKIMLAFAAISSAWLGFDYVGFSFLEWVEPVAKVAALVSATGTAILAQLCVTDEVAQ